MGDGRIAALDGVRGLAVAAVVVFHVDLLRGGWVGVDVFFVLSGFLITTLLLSERDRTGRIGLGAFWKRRARRLLPALLVVVTAVSVTSAVAGRVAGALRGDVLATLGYVANWHFIRTGESYFATFEPSPVRHAWSLAIEEQFYLVWPLVILVLLRVRPSWRIAAVAAATVASTGWMHHITADAGALSRAYYGSDTRAATILIGCLAALVVDATRHRAGVVAALRRRSAAVVVVAAAILVAVAVAVPEDSTWLYRGGGFTAVAVVAVALVVAAAHLPPGGVARFLAGPALVRLGLISYSLYLWHWPVVVVLERSGLPRFSQAAVAVVASVTLAEATFRLVERPLRRWRLPHPSVAVGAGVAAVVAVTMVATAGPVQGSSVPAATSGTITARPPTVPTTSTTSTTTTTTTVPFLHLDRSSGRPIQMQEATTTLAPTTVAPTTVPPVELPLDVVVLGDSAAWMFAGRPPPDVPFSVRGTWHAECDIVGRRLYLGEQINEEDENCPTRPVEWATALDGPVDAVVVMLGLRQLFDLDVDGTRVPVGSPEWEAEYRTGVGGVALADVRAGTTAPVLWFDVPCYDWAAAGTAGEEHDAERLRIVNEVLRSALAVDPGVTVVDYAGQVCDGTASIPERRPDGAHLSETAAHEIWRWIAPQLVDAVQRTQ